MVWIKLDMNITLSKGGTGERTVELSKIVIPDLWHIAHNQEFKGDKEAIILCWHLCHDLRRTLEEMEHLKRKLHAS